MKRLGLGLGVVLAVGSSVPQAAEACIHGKARVIRQVDPTERDVKSAEQLLARGRHAGSVARAKRAFREVDQLPPGAEVASLFDRAQRTAAMAAVRSGGRVDLGPGRRGKTDVERELNLHWAALVMQYQAARNPDNLVVATEYAEALSKLPHMQSAAHDILASLAADDLMPTARGYALLAALRMERGDTMAGEAALARCQEIAPTSDACKVA